MRINKISWKNFASYGDNLQTIEFSDNNNLWLLNGLNGSGKSTISDVLSFALFGKVEGKNKSELPNRINKKLYTEIELLSKGHLIRIKRGANPNIFMVSVNNDPIDFLNIDLQTYLEKELYEIPYSIFNNLLVLSINDFKSFLTMSPSDKKLIFDKLFGFSILNQMKDFTKIEKNKRKEQLLLKNNTLQTNLNTISRLETAIKEEEQRISQNNSHEIHQLQQKLAQLSSTLLEYENIGRSKALAKQEQETIVKDKQLMKNNITQDINRVKIIVETYSNNVTCPMCLSNLTDKSVLVENLKAQLETFYTNLNSVNSELSTLFADLEISSKDVQMYRDFYLNCKNQISEATQKIQQLELVKTSNTDKFRDMIKSTVLDNLQLQEAINQIELDIKNDTMFEEMVSDGGIKAMLIKQMIPTLNYELLELCNKVNFKYSLEFDDKLDVKLTKLGEAIPIKTLSTGEKKMADFICIITILKYIKFKYNNFNLLFLDEIFSSIDSDKIYEITNILKLISDSLGLQVFVMHHAPLPSEYFDKFCDVSNIDGFSQISIS